MSNLNPFRILSNLESGKSEGKELGITDAVIAAVSFILILLLPVQGIAYGIINDSSSNTILQSSLYILLVLIIIFLTVTTIFYGYYIININQDKIKVYNIKKFTLINIIFVFLCILGYLLFFDSLLMPIDKMLPGFNLVTENMQFMSKNLMFIIGFVFIIGPVLNEFVFRGILVGGLLKKFSNTKSILISALIYGILTFNLSGFVCAFPLGIFLGYLYVKTRSLYLCIFADILYSVITFSLLQYYPQFLLLISSNIFVIACLTIIGLLLMYLGLKKLSLNSQNINLQK